MSLLRAENLVKTFQRGTSEIVHAVNDVSFSIDPGETLALIGESGSGKSTVGRLLLRLLEVDSGSVQLDGVDLMSLGKEHLRRMRSQMQLVFQEPYESLNPRMKIGDIVAEPLEIHEPHLSRYERRERVVATLNDVGLPAEYAHRYARSMSGGQQQRVGIARALVTRPKLLVLDEPTSSLDLSVQAQILEILDALQQAHGIAYLYISHDLATVQYIADRVAVMYLGQIRELGSMDDILTNPSDPYTQTLLGAFLDPDPYVQSSTYKPLVGEIPSTTSLPSGCFFHTRCPDRIPECMGGSTPPLLRREGTESHEVRCLRVHGKETIVLKVE